MTRNHLPRRPSGRFRRPRAAGPLAALFLICSLASPAAAEEWEEVCEQRCAVPSGDNVVLIDAAKPEITSSNSPFPPRTGVTLAIKNKNPFHCTYELEVEAIEIELATIRGFLEQLQLIPGARDDAEAARLDAEAEAAGDQEVDDLTCALSGFQDAMKKMREQRLAAIEAYKAIIKGLNEADKEIESYNAFAERVKKPIVGEAVCRSVCKQAGAAVDSLEKATQLKDLKMKLDELKTLASKMDTAQKFFKDRLQEMPTGTEEERLRKQICKDELELNQSIVGDTDGDSTKAAGQVEKLEKQVPELKIARKNINDVLANPDAFVERRPLPVRDAPTRYDLSLEVECGTADAKTTELGSVQVGRNRFSISAGLGISFIEEQTFGRQSALVPTMTTEEDGTVVSGTELGSVFAITETSSEHLAGVFQLNARFCSLGKKASFGWSLGAEIASEDGSAEFSLYTGPSFGFLDDKMFFTLAFHQREVETLTGFEVGDPIPMELQDPLPTVKDDDSGLLVTVTYRFN